MFWLVLLHAVIFNSVQYTFCKVHTCSSDIYCHGRLLHVIQMSKIYEDSKQFVDMKMRYTRNKTMTKFNAFMTKSPRPTKAQVKDFIEDTFEPEGQEFEKWEPSDWKKQPKFVENIKDATFKQWAYELNAVWKLLGKKMKSDVKQNEHLYSIIWVPNPVIVPGGRFREFYYWDSYWIIQGLLLSEMHDTVKGMLSNFLYILDKYGLIPNGGRVYYLTRSQPPLFLPMMKSYMDATGDKDFVIKNVPIMEKEFEYWMECHTIAIDLDAGSYTLAVYGGSSTEPRPESYSEDVDSAWIFRTQQEKEAYYSELRAAAESGWDFSSRWFITDGTNEGNLTSIKTKSIIPVDLNAMIYWNAVLLAEFNEIAGNQDKVKHYTDVANKWMKAVEAVLWHEEAGIWLDYDLQNKIKRNYFSLSNFAPLWTGCYDRSKTTQIVKKVLTYFKTKNVLYDGGIPTTLRNTGEQWDFPNGWPPLEHMMIVGLNNTGDVDARNMAFDIAKRWVRSNFKAYREKKAMYEKYDTRNLGGQGGGGEYEVQTGFGWTNGVIMDLLNKYSKTITLDDDPVIKHLKEKSSTSSEAVSYIQIATALLHLWLGCIYCVRIILYHNS